MTNTEVPQGQLDLGDPEGLVVKPAKGHYVMGSGSCYSFSRKQSGNPLIWEQELKLNGLNTKLGRRRNIVECLAEKPLKARQIITHNPLRRCDGIHFRDCLHLRHCRALIRGQGIKCVLPGCDDDTGSSIQGGLAGSCFVGTQTRSPL